LLNSDFTYQQSLSFGLSISAEEGIPESSTFSLLLSGLALTSVLVITRKARRTKNEGYEWRRSPPAPAVARFSRVVLQELLVFEHRLCRVPETAKELCYVGLRLDYLQGPQRTVELRDVLGVEEQPSTTAGRS
jgi:hypothetical protein